MSLFFITSLEMSLHLAQQAQEKRLALNWTQKMFSLRSGVSYGVINNLSKPAKSF